MVRKLREWPEKDELVIVTITALNPNSAFAKLDEYEGRQGMIHVSEVATTWVKDIRKFLRIGQRVVALVRQVDERANVVHLSIKRVSAGSRKEKMTEFENEKKAEKLLEFAAKALGKSLRDAYADVVPKLQEKFGTMYAGFEAAYADPSSLAAAGIPQNWAAQIVELARKTIKPKEVSIKAMLELKCLTSNGIEVIKKALAIKEAGVEIRYISAPRYSIVVRGASYPECEKKLEAASASILSAIKAGGGEGQLIRR